LTLIGTVHHDPRSAAPLAALLTQLQPDLLTVEISPDVVAYRQTHGVLLLRKLGMIVERLLGQAAPTPLAEHSGIAAIRNLLGLPYEFCVAGAYAEEKGIVVQAIDQSDSSLAKLRPVEERLISLQHLRRIVASPGTDPPEDNAHRYVLARQLLASPDVRLRSAFLQGCRGEEGIGPRDRHQAAKIRSLLQSQPGHLVHIGGWVHLLDDPDNETL